MHYLTRHLVALREQPVGDRLVPVGGTFYATEVDAVYLTGNKSAEDAPPDAPAAIAWAPQTVAAIAQTQAPTPTVLDAVQALAASHVDAADPALDPAEPPAPAVDASLAAANANTAAPAESTSVDVADAGTTAAGETDGAVKAAEQGGDEDTTGTAPASRRRAGRPSNAEIQARQAAAKAGASGS